MWDQTPIPTGTKIGCFVFLTVVITCLTVTYKSMNDFSGTLAQSSVALLCSDRIKDINSQHDKEMQELSKAFQTQLDLCKNPPKKVVPLKGKKK